MTKPLHLHFMGIGGIGMSGLAKIFRQRGNLISGCDNNLNQKSIEDLKALGCTISEGNNNKKCNDPSIDTLIYSTAINKNNPELTRAQQGITKTRHRSELLGFLMSEKFSIAVAGTHGKTTTSSILSHILLEGKIDPTVIIGGHLNSIKSNAHAGNSQFLVAEADESDRSFLNLFPTIAIITNINFDHAETYDDLDDVKETFTRFLKKLPDHGKAIVCGDDKNIQSLLSTIKAPLTTYGFNDNCNWKIVNETLETDHSIFYLKNNSKTFGPLTLPMPGKHNVLNATSAFIAALSTTMSPETIIKTLATFDGVDRRFTFKGTYNGARIIDDYGHHPNEIKNALAIARKQTNGKLRVLFQPHRYSRTKSLWDDFIAMFLESKIDELIITDIYPASETPLEGISSQNLVKALQDKKADFTVQYLPLDQNFSTLLAHLKKTLTQNDLLMLQGAGKVNSIADKLTSISI